MNFYIVKGEGLVEDKKQKWICIAIGLFLCFPSLNSAIGSIIKFSLGTQFKLGTYVIYAIYYLVMLYALYKNIRRISVSTFAITVFMIISFMLSISLNPITPYVWTSFGNIVENPMYLFLFYDSGNDYVGTGSIHDRAAKRSTSAVYGFLVQPSVLNGVFYLEMYVKLWP